MPLQFNKPVITGPPESVRQVCGMNSIIRPPDCSGAIRTRSPSVSCEGHVVGAQQRLQRARAFDGDGGADHDRQLGAAP